MTALDAFRLDGDTALVTGAASGLGRAFSTTLADAGANVALADVDESVHGVADEVANETGADTLGVEADVTDETSVERMVEACVDAFGGLDVGFANAGVGLLEPGLDEYEMDTWERIVGVNLRGLFLTTRAFSRAMSDGGRIVHVGSILGFTAQRARTPFAYVASKGATHQLTRQTAVALAPAIRVNAIAPGYIRTGIGDGFLSEAAAEADDRASRAQAAIADQTPLGRLGDPSEVATLGLFLASEASSFCTGGVYVVDGGWTVV